MGGVAIVGVVRVSTEKELGKVVLYARKIVRSAADNRIAEGSVLWVSLLLERTISAVQSIRVLLPKRKYADCFVLKRIVYDHSLQIGYILQDPSKTDELLELYSLEIVADLYDVLKVKASYRNMTVERLAMLDAGARNTLKRYKKAQLHPAWKAGGRDWPKRWRMISADEMAKATLKKGRDTLHWYVGSAIGDAFVHARPMALELFSRWRRTALLKNFPVPKVPYKPREIRGECAGYLLAAANEIVDALHFDDLEPEGIRLSAELFPHTCRDGKWLRWSNPPR